MYEQNWFLCCKASVFIIMISKIIFVLGQANQISIYYYKYFTRSILELAHVNIWIPHNTNTSRCFLTVVAHLYRGIRAFLMQFKHKTFSNIRISWLWLRINLQPLLKEPQPIMLWISSNQNVVFFPFPRDYLWDLMYPYSPANGTVEKKGRYLLNVAKALKFQAKVPKL